MIICRYRRIFDIGVFYFIIGLAFFASDIFAGQNDFFTEIDGDCFECRTTQTPKSGCDVKVFERFGTISIEKSAVVYAPWGNGKTTLYKKLISDFKELSDKLKEEKSELEQGLQFYEKSSSNSYELDDDEYYKDLKNEKTQIENQLADVNKKNNKINGTIFVTIDDVILKQIFPDNTSATRFNTLEKAINAFTNNVASGKSVEENRKIISKSWQDKDMLDFMISQMVSNVVMKINKNEFNFKDFADKLTPDEYRLFLGITFLYHNGNNLDLGCFLDKLQNSYSNLNASVDDSCVNKVKTIMGKIKILDSASTHVDKMNFICKIFNKDDFQSLEDKGNNLDSNNIFLKYKNFIEKAGKDVVFIVDALENVKGLEINDGYGLEPFKAVVRSMYPLLDFATRNEIKFYLFLTKLENVRFEDLFPNFASKINFLEFNWKLDDSEAYADFILSSCRLDEKKAPKTLKELVGGEKCVNQFLDKQDDPRKVNKVLAALAIESEFKQDYENTPGCGFVDGIFRRGKVVVSATDKPCEDECKKRLYDLDFPEEQVEMLKIYFQANGKKRNLNLISTEEADTILEMIYNQYDVSSKSTLKEVLDNLKMDTKK